MMFEFNFFELEIAKEDRAAGGAKKRLRLDPYLDLESCAEINSGADTPNHRRLWLQWHKPGRTATLAHLKVIYLYM